MSVSRLPVGTRLVLQIGPVAHGGHCVARHDGQVVFVRHTLPGEQVEAEVTSIGAGGKFLRADAVRVLTASPDRVPAPCPYAGPGRCGGCDFQHVDLPAQRALKAAVLTEALHRIGRLEHIGGTPLAVAVRVDPVPGELTGLGWRTRVGYAVAPDGVLGLHRHRTHEVEPVAECRLAHPAVTATDVTRRRWPGYDTVEVVVSAAGDQLLVLKPPGRRPGVLDGLAPEVAVAGVRGRAWVTESAAGRDWRVDGAGFWQVHPGAADLLVGTVRELLAPRAGEHLLDLYAGVGLFAGALADELGPGGRVDAVEASERAVRDARRNLHDLPQVRLHEAPVAEWLARREVRRADIVVLDPPRAGAGTAVLRAVLALAPRAVAYVACDPAALARDLRVATGLGWSVAALRAFDLFPMTHHLETVALLVPPVSPEVS